MANANRNVFVMMPSGKHGEYGGEEEESDFIYTDIIRPALRNVLGDGPEIIRETDNRDPGAITRDLIHHIANADICIVDVTGQNPNVFLELGIRYALRRAVTILIRQPEVVLPFDITDYRCVEYSSKYGGVKKAVGDIAEAVKAATTRSSARSDSLVFNVISDLRVEIPGLVAAEHEPAPNTMPWSTYWAQFESVVTKLGDVVQDGVFVPQVVLGISNGGLIYADLLGRHLFTGIPILSLWADRMSKDGTFFKDPVNDGIIEGIKSRGATADTKTILLVDDIVASGGTLGQALKFLDARLPDWTVYFLPLFSRNEKYLEIIEEHIIWLAAPGFKGKMTVDEVRSIHAAEIPMLPYKKEIRST